MKFDNTDKKLIELLQKNSKQTTKRLSLLLNLSVTAVYERIKKLEREKIIKKYVALIDRKKVEKSFMVFCYIRLSQHTKDYITSFEKEILKLTEVSECFHISGDYDYLLKVCVKDMDAYREFMLNKITALKHIGNTHSIFTIGEVKNTTEIIV